MSGFQIDALIEDRGIDIVVCCGSGGVGKTTTAASFAVRAAEAGRHVVVLTIDPAKRLAQSLGIEELGNTPVAVPAIDESAGGSLSAMMLDMKRTFDEVIEAHASPEKAQAILSNPFYVAMSTSFAGTSEYMAMEKLGQLRAKASVKGGSAEQPWDLIVVDTPPSRSALDFLDAPDRLASFLDGRLIRLLTAPARAGGRFGVKTLSSVVTGAGGLMGKLLGQQTLHDVQTFVAATDTMFGGFRERAEQTYDMLRGSNTAFLVVACPESDALREASFFIQRLNDDKMPLAGVVVNRVVETALPELTSDRASVAADRLRRNGDDVSLLAADLLAIHEQRMRRREVEQSMLERFTSAHHGVGVACAPLQPVDVVDVESLRMVAESIAASGD